MSRIIAYLVGENAERPSEDTGAYCKARKKLPELLFKKLLDKSSQNLENQVDKNCLWHGRHVKSIDGSTVSMPDTVENQKAYPQHPSQKIGCGREGGILSYLCHLKVICGDIPPPSRP